MIRSQARIYADLSKRQVAPEFLKCKTPLASRWFSQGHEAHSLPSVHLDFSKGYVEFITSLLVKRPPLSLLSLLLHPTFKFLSKMAIARALPTNLPQKPTDIPPSDNRGLSVGATIGIGIGIALLFILGAIGAWIFVRRRRRTWVQERREQSDPEIEGDTPDVEIAKKIQKIEKYDSLDKELAVEIGSGEQDIAELAVGKDMKPHTVPQTGAQEYEMPSTHEPLKVGEGRTFAAELEGSGVPGGKGT